MTNSEFIALSKIFGDQIRTNKICPRCGGQLVERSGYNGRFIGCTNFLNGCCSFTKKRIDYITEEELMYYKNKENK